MVVGQQDLVVLRPNLVAHQLNLVALQLNPVVRRPNLVVQQRSTGRPWALNAARVEGGGGGTTLLDECHGACVLVGAIGDWCLWGAIDVEAVAVGA